MNFLDSLSRRLSGAAAVVATLCTVGLALAITTDVVARLVSGRSLPGLVEASETLLVTLIFLGLAFASYTGGQITMDLVTSALPKRVSAWVRFAGDLVTLTLLGWMLVATASRAIDSFLGGEFKFGLVHWPLWPARTSIVVGLALCIPIYVLFAWRDVSEALGRYVPDHEVAVAAAHV